LLKQSKKLIKKVSGKGRNAKTGWTTVQDYIAYIIWMKNVRGQHFFNFLNSYIFKEPSSLQTG
jgi:hypothetical protein